MAGGGGHTAAIFVPSGLMCRRCVGQCRWGRSRMTYVHFVLTRPFNSDFLVLLSVQLFLQKGSGGEADQLNVTVVRSLSAAGLGDAAAARSPPGVSLPVFTVRLMYVLRLFVLSCSAPAVFQTEHVTAFS